MRNDAAIEEIIGFWLGDGTTFRPMWFEKSVDIDREIRDRFGAWVARASAGDLEGWLDAPRGCLAYVILLDQFTRNIHRDDAAAFAHDALARAATRFALARGHDADMPLYARLFLYLPLEHSENLADQADSVRLIAALGNDDLTRYAEAHCDIIARFGRFPHRNAVLGRDTTPEEALFLTQPGSSF